MRGRPKKNDKTLYARVNVTIPADYKAWAKENDFQFSEEMRRLIYKKMCEEENQKKNVK